ncbi:hypothetical protein Verru16b_00386 [Lacunisphaera limnophila]|uniref:Uncharacterized protein n=2 Tax=Lacunisphaera limnophila TaxID=1838286 RepID=A0A1D8AR29_9BACT|nr:hypothetical protein Verru16b_00386 [Lacunisphaera limnophila]
MLYIERMHTASNTPDVPAPKMRPFFKFLLWSVLLNAFCAVGARGMLRHYDIMGWLRVPLALTPLLPFAYGVYCYHSATRGRRDELEQRIVSDAAAAGFFVLFLMLTIAGMLRSGGILADFAWTPGVWEKAMLISLGAGWVWSVRRYR